VSLTVKFKGDSSSFDKALNKVKSGMNSVKAPVVAVAKTVAVLSAAFAAAAAAAGAIIYKLVKIGEEANTQNARLANITKQMGLFGGEAGKVSERLSKFAEAQARLTGTDNAAIKQTQAKLMTFRELAETADEVGGSFDRATVAALDMAAAGFGSATENAVQLGKALNDPIRGVTALARSGITFTEQERQKIAALVESNRMLEAQDMILSAIEKQVSKTAQATANATDKLAEMRKQLMNAFAQPVADAFENLTMNAESTFLALEQKFAKAGKFFASALEDAMQGDASKFLAIGKMIGDLLSDGIKIAFDASIWTIELALRRLALSIAESDPMIGKDSALAGKLREAVSVGEQARASNIDSGFKEAIDNLNKNIAEMNRQMREDAVYKAGFRAGGTDRITDPSKVDRIFEEFLDETKKTNQLLERFEEDRKGP
jgi:hypothetical protein